MSTVIPDYPFDPTGLAETNLVTETQAIESRGTFEHYYVVPRVGPFYAESVKLRLYPIGANVNNPTGGQLLEEGEHYNFGYHFAYASHTIGKPVYGCITFYDRTLKGQLRMEYQTIGDDWVLDDAAWNELLLNKVYNPRIGTWEQVVELPREFPVVNHDFNIDDFVGMSEVEDRLSDIEAAISQSQEGGLGDHVEDKSNPHDVSKDQVGLGLVDNYPTAALAEATTGVANNRFMTPLRTKQAIDVLILPQLNAHKADVANPHQVTKAQVGLGSVQNLALSSQAEAESGSSNARYMTPLRTREAIEAIVGITLNDHLGDFSNPHAVTKAQVGLGNVVNIGIATDAAALQGADDSGVITPRVLSLVLAETVGSGVTDHIQDFSNPHAVTKAQVGLGLVNNYPIANEAEARDATANDRFMTPLGVRRAISELIGAGVTDHIQDFSNPHAVTKVQVGLGLVDNYRTANEAEARDATADDRFMTPIGVRHAISELVGAGSDAHIGDYNNPHQVTAAQVGTYDRNELDLILAGKLGTDEPAADTELVYGLDQPALAAWIGTQKAGNTALFDGRTFAAATAEILSGKAADSNRLDGKTYSEIIQAIGSAVEGGSSKWDVPPIPAIELENGSFTTAPLNWLRIGHYKESLSRAYGDMTLLITGGRDEDAEVGRHHTILFELSVTKDFEDPAYPDFNPLTIRSAVTRHLTAADEPIEIGYVVNQAATNATIDIYIRSVGQRAGWTISELTTDFFVIGSFPTPTEIADLITVEPAGIIYADVIGDGYAERLQAQAHIANTSNPHQVTKAQVGLGSVDNFATATNAIAITGTATNRFMTPASTQAKVDDSIGVLCTELIEVMDDALANLFV